MISSMGQETCQILTQSGSAAPSDSAFGAAAPCSTGGFSAETLAGGVTGTVFKKRAGSPRAAMLTSLSIVLVFAAMILLRQRFFVAFFAAYITAGLLLNLAWKAGWHGIEPPRDGAEDMAHAH